MTADSSGWLSTFLGQRELDQPDGRPLYAYRCTADEFADLRVMLTRDAVNHPITSADVRAFALYAAEWWQRRYDGSHWAWGPLLDSIRWDIHYRELYEPVRRAWHWWRVDLVRLPTSVRYLGTFACQGGLPLAVMRRPGNKVTTYLRAVLKHTVAYRQFVEDPIELARDQQRLLRPPTLCRDYVLRLAADLIEAVLHVQSDARSSDPLAALDRTRPGWRDAMPLDLEDAQARELLTGLLREARETRVSSAIEFRVERFVRHTALGWRLGASVQLPTTLAAEDFARLIGVSGTDLPPRLEVRTQGDRILGWYAARSEDFVLASTTRSPIEFWDENAAGEVRLRFLAGDEIGESMVPKRGAALSELPWSFRTGDECSFVGEGTVSSRAPEMLVLVSKSSSLHGSEPPDGSAMAEGSVHALDRFVWRVSAPVVVETTSGRCTIRPSSQQAPDEEYRLSGKRLYDLSAAHPLFLGTPILRVAKADGTPRALPAREIEWRTGGREWRASPTGPGLWQVRHVHAGELRFLGRVGVLPRSMSVAIEPGQEISKGHVLLQNADGVRVAAKRGDATATFAVVDSGIRVHATATDSANPPVRLLLRLQWPGASELVADVPFPGQGGRFVVNGRSVHSRISLDQLYGVKATALSPSRLRRFWLEGELRADDLGDLRRIAHLRVPLKASGVQHELSLADERSRLALLVAASSSSDAHVALRIVDDAQREHAVTQVYRCAAAIDYEPDLALVTVSPPPETVTTFQALPVAQPAIEATPLTPLGPGNASAGAIRPDSESLSHSRVLLVGRNDHVQVRPLAVGGKSAPTTTYPPPRLREAVNLADSDVRQEALGAAIDAMLESDDRDPDEEEWSFLNDYIRLAEDLPATALDLLGVLVTKPQFLVRCLFRLDVTPRKLLWRLEEELPFSWLLVPRRTWWSEAKRAFDQLRETLANLLDSDNRDRARDMAHAQMASILEEGEQQIAGLLTVATDVTARLAGGRVSSDFVKAVATGRDRALSEVIRLRASLDDWPKGDSRQQWCLELERGELIQRFWLHRDEHPDRQPFFDTPVAAAWSCYFGEPTARTVFLVKQMRAHDIDWFDRSYTATWFALAETQDRTR